MKKYIILFLVGVLIFELTFFISYKVFEKNSKNDSDIDLGAVEFITEETVSQEEKIGVDADFIIERKYKKCKHDKEIIQKVDKEMINLTKEEFEEKYPYYDIEKFSKDRIIVEEKNDGLCDEHYVMRLGDDYIEVFWLNSEGEEQLYLVTNIRKDYLAKEDIGNLKNGIDIFGRSNINLKLEDYE